MNKRYCITAFITAVMLLLAGCSSGGQVMDGEDMVRGYTQISQEEARQMMEQDGTQIIVDVRTQEEYDSGHIPGAICIPNESIGCDSPEALPDYDQIILTRPTVVLGNQDIGFLPGDQKSKMSPFIQPLMDNLNVIKAKFKSASKEALKLDAMLKEEKLLISPLAYIRGRSLGRVFFICDEAQNLTPNEVKTIITRAGEGTKMVFTGDIFQIDQPYLDQWSNGLTHLSEKMSGQKLFEHVFLRVGERSELSDLASKLL